MKYLAVAALLLATSPSLAQVPAAGKNPDSAVPPRLTVELTPQSISIGDQVEVLLTLEIEASPAAAPRFPTWGQHWGDAEVLAVDEPQDEGNGIWRQRLSITVFETGLATLPAVEVQVPLQDQAPSVASTGPKVLQVESILPPGEQEIAPQPPEPVRQLSAGLRFWWAAAVLGLACAVLGLLLLRAAQRIRQSLAAMALNPLEALSQALVRLRTEDDARRLLTGLSLELRRYLGRAVGFPAAEGTTTEIQRRLREREVPPELVRDTLALLREVDQIKFARGVADTRQANSRIDDTEQLAKRVEEWLQPELDEARQPEAAT
jgi:hypothetical protein